jgi:repressor LexA
MTLTPRQAELRRFIQSYIEAYGIAPTYREMADGIGAASNSGIYRLLVGMEQRGAVRWVHGSARSLELLMPPEASRTALEALQDALAPYPVTERVAALESELGRLEGLERAA